MRKLLFVTSALTLATHAFAADMPLKAPPLAPVRSFSWTGVYAGINGGFGWENTETRYSYSSIPAPAPPGFQDIFGPGGPLNIGGTSAESSAIAQGFLPTSLGNHHAATSALGGQLGYNYQTSLLVLGIEADLDSIGGSKSTSFTALPNGIITNMAAATAGLQWLGTVRARAGYAFDRALFFATGGLAYGRVTASTNGSGSDGFNTDLFAGNTSGIRTGYAVGGGIEYAITGNLIAKAEYIYYNLGTASYAVPAANAIAIGEGLFINASQKFDGSLVRFGLNLKFGS
jgi:outer membrane immunogenic protein